MLILILVGAAGRGSIVLILVGAAGPWKHCVDIGRSNGAVEALC